MIERFEANRSRLRAVAYRMLGSSAEAEDAVQEAWLRLNRTGDAGIDNLDAWLTTVVGRVCLDMLRARGARREDAYEAEPPAAAAPTGPEEETLLADSVGVALLVVLETLTPVERLAFVLHDTFGVSFEEIAPIVGRSPTAARQLASRARRRVRQQQHADRPADRRIVDAFLTASRAGDFTTLLSLLDPDVRLRADEAAQRIGRTTGLAGSTVVAQFFAGRAQGARPALIDGLPGLWVGAGPTPRIAVLLTIDDGRITAMEAIADPETLRDLEIVPLDS